MENSLESKPYDVRKETERKSFHHQIAFNQNNNLKDFVGNIVSA